MHADVLRAIDGVAIYPVISLVIFVVVFVGMLIWVCRLRAQDVDAMGRMPLEPDQVERAAEEQGGQHHD